MKRPLIPLLIMPLLAHLAAAQERATGYLPPTPEQKALAEANMVKVTKVLPNRLALQRVAAERKSRRNLTLAAKTPAPAEDGAEFSGYKGASPPVARRTSNLTASLMAYPRAVDNSNEAWFPPIGDQKGIGSCAAYSTAYYTMTSQVARLRGWNVKTGKDPAQIFSPRFIYNLINNGQDLGSYHLTAYDYMIAIGCATYADFPYNSVDYKSWPTTASVWREALNYRMKEQGMVMGIDTAAGLANAKQMLADGYIFNFVGATGGFTYTSLSDDPATTTDDELFAAGLPDSRRRVISHSVSAAVNHAMTIVGYNDDLWCDINSNGVVDAGEKGALRLANSWSTNWEDRGFVWVSYDSLKTVSAVPGGYSGPRQESIADHRLAWMSARPSYTPSLVAEVTVTHGKRDQMILDVGRGQSSSAIPARMGRLSGLANKGGGWAFDGTTTPVAATFVLDCTDLMTSGSGNRWFATLEDNTPDAQGTFTSVRFVNSNGGVTAATGTNPGGGLPKFVDNTTVHAFADNVQEAVIPVIPVGPAGYTWCSGEGGSFSLPGTCDVAYGANGVFIYLNNLTGVVNFDVSTFGSDPVPNVVKSGFYKTSTTPVTPPATPVGPAGYTWCVAEGGNFTLPGECNIAYGADGKFAYSLNRSGIVSFTNRSFGDPIEGVYKSGFYKPLSSKLGPVGFTWCSGEDGGFTLPGLSDVAYGSNGKFTYLTNRTGTVNFNVITFGIDPNENVLKSGFYRLTSSIVPPEGFTWCAGEGGSFTLPGASDVAYGANGMFNFVQNRTGVVRFTPSEFGGDPNNGILKSGFYKLLTPSNNPVGPEGYTWCSSEFGTFTLPGVCDLAYGANGAFVYKTGRSGTVTFNTGYFGFDPVHGVTKSGFYKRTLASGVALAGGKNLANSQPPANSKVNGVASALQSVLTKAGGSVGTCKGRVITFKKRPTNSGIGKLTYRIEVSSDLGKKGPWTKVDSTQNDSEITAKLPKTQRQVFVRLCVGINP